MKEEISIQAMNRSRKENDELTARIDKIETFLINEPVFSSIDIASFTAKLGITVVLGYIFITSVMSVTATMFVTELPNFCTKIGYEII